MQKYIKKICVGSQSECFSTMKHIFHYGSLNTKIKNDILKKKKMIRYNEPVKRFGTPEEIVYLKVFLFSQKASFVTGSVLAVG